MYNDFEPEKGGGGVARHIAGLAETLAARGMAIRVVAKVVDSAAGCGAYQVERAGWRELRRHVIWADIVHIHGARKPYAAFAAFLAVLLRRRLIYTPHCYYEGSGVLKKLAKRLWDATGERWLLRQSNAVILLSEHWLRYLAARRLPVAHPEIIPNCVLGRDVDGRRRLHSGKLLGAPALLSVGRLDPVKRLDDAIRALTCNTLAGAVLHIVGRGPDEERLASLVEELGVGARVKFYGFVDDAEVAQLVAGADVFVLPSAIEGMPTVLIEMLLLGLPVVASDIPGNRAILDLLGLEVLFPVGNVPCMAERIAAAAVTPLSETVGRTVQENFTWERNVHRVAALYLQCKQGAGAD
ncbi:glycosyltransferase family 4 protein [Methylomonas fluvii]|uniref:glycosyltransferase family 4 protein n=1 Tax=Methylomonas fluvii TaxID=1854564 RepID=UPI001CAA8908|nr:glycosyltransferase family 4 protein [Methylomonas fluvii]